MTAAIEIGGFTDVGNVETSRQASGSHRLPRRGSRASTPRYLNGVDGRQSGLCEVLEEVVRGFQSLVLFHYFR